MCTHRVLTTVLFLILALGGCPPSPSPSPTPNDHSDPNGAPNNPSTTVQQLDARIAPSSDGALPITSVDGRALAVGDAVAGPGADGAGFLRRVTGFQYDSAGQVVGVQTAQASLEEVVEPGTTVTVQERFSLGAAAGAQKRNATAASDDCIVDFSDTTLYDENDFYLGITEGCLGFDPEITLEAEFGVWPPGVDSVTFTATGTLHADLVVQARGLVSVSAEHKVNLNDILNGGQPYSHTFQAGYVFGVIKLWLYAGFEAELSAGGVAEAGGHASASLTTGAEYVRDQGWSPVVESSRDFTQVGPTLDLHGDFEGRVYFYPRVEVWIYGAIGPWIEVEPSIDLIGHVDTCGVDWSLGAAVDARVGGTVKVLSWTIADIGPFHLLDRTDTRVELAGGELPFDADGDGTGNCVDGCPDDPNKTQAGSCDCGVSDTDSDGDTVPDCHDGCPNDPNKTQPGNCDCGQPETPGCGAGPQPWSADEFTVALWHLDGNGSDASGNGLDLAVKPQWLAWETARFDHGATMTGTPSGGGCPDAAALTAPGSGCGYPGSGDWTVEAWVAVPGNTDGYAAVYHYSQHVAGHDPFYLGVASGSATFEINGTVRVSADVSQYAGTWVHIAGVYRYQQDIAIAVNGQRMATLSTTAVIERLPQYKVFLGGAYCGNSVGMRLDEVRISNVARY